LVTTIIPMGNHAVKHGENFELKQIHYYERNMLINIDIIKPRPRSHNKQF